MIRVVLQGRTGNHFFQYAAARWLAERHGTGVILDGSWLRPRNWSQAGFLKAMALKSSLRRWPLWIGPVLRVSLRRHPSEFTMGSVYRENPHDSSFDPAFHEMPDGSLLIGYFQSARYFPSMRELLQKEINYRDLPMDTETRALAARMGEGNSVSIHVRRGDFLLYSAFAVCTPSYFQRAVALARERVASPMFWIFSDDIPWCRSFFKGGEYRFVDLAQSWRDPLNDMRLMSLAAHHIISNSSYSWWGAWLHWTPEKLVIAPNRWLLGSYIVPISEKLEDDWIRIEPGENSVETPGVEA